MSDAARLCRGFCPGSDPPAAPHCTRSAAGGRTGALPPSLLPSRAAPYAAASAEMSAPPAIEINRATEPQISQGRQMKAFGLVRLAKQCLRLQQRVFLLQQARLSFEILRHPEPASRDVAAAGAVSKFAIP